MKITIKNFGAINEASVCIGGLTVIAGENDTGKSTIGKILFSLVKAFSKIEDDLIEDRNNKIFSAIESIYFNLRRKVSINEMTIIRNGFLPPKFMDNILIYGDQAIYERQSMIHELFESKHVDEDFYNFTKQQLESIQAILNEDKDPRKATQNAIRKAFYSEFKGEIVNKNNNEKATIKIADGATLILEMVWSKTELSSLTIHDNLYFDDATYFESASILQFHQFIQSAQTLFTVSHSRHVGKMVPLHIKDLSRKLQDSIYTMDITNNNHFNGIFDGDFYFDNESNQFLLDRNGHKFDSNNVASGIKNLGVFNMLSSSGHVNNKTLTILDEPEINLHPDWQVQYAKHIVEVVKSGANIIVTTHSPYIVEALYLYSEYNDLNPNIYLTEKHSSGTLFLDTSNNLTKIMDKLASPLNRLHKEVDDDF